MVRSGAVAYGPGMASVRDTWGALSPARRLAAIGGALAPVVAFTLIVALAAGGLGPGPAPVAAEPTPFVVPPGETAPPLPPDPTPDPSATPAPTATPAPPQADPILGTDGRLTILLLGSDYRPAHPGNRTDALIVVSVDPVSGATGAFSIPRDTEDFPLPGGGVYRAKVNGLYQDLHAKTREGGAGMKEVVSAAYDLEVDSYVFIGFAGFRQLIAEIGGVEVTLDKAYYDPYYWVNNRTQGWGLPKGTSHLDADEALIFARSRKGDNDFGRARRQQILIMAVLDKVRSQGPERLPRLLAIAADTVRTDLPLQRAADVFEIIAGVDLETANRTVFGPRTYTIEKGGSAFAPDLDACRAWIAKHFPPARPYGQWPPDPDASTDPSVPPASPSS